MAADGSDSSFDDRFMAFYGTCSVEEQQFLSWLFSFSPDTSAVDGEPDVQGFGGSLADAANQLQQIQMTFNMQYLQLQSQMQLYNRSETTISSVMRTKHDTVKNSISNIR